MGAIAPGPPKKEGPPISDKKFINGVLKKKTPSVSNLIKLSMKSLDGHCITSICYDDILRF